MFVAATGLLACPSPDCSLHVPCVQCPLLPWLPTRPIPLYVPWTVVTYPARPIWSTLRTFPRCPSKLFFPVLVIRTYSYYFPITESLFVHTLPLLWVLQGRGHVFSMS